MGKTKYFAGTSAHDIGNTGVVEGKTFHARIFTFLWVVPLSLASSLRASSLERRLTLFLLRTLWGMVTENKISPRFIAQTTQKATVVTWRVANDHAVWWTASAPRAESPFSSMVPRFAAWGRGDRDKGKTGVVGIAHFRVSFRSRFVGQRSYDLLKLTKK